MFEELAESCVVTRERSKKLITSADIESAFQIRLLTTIKEWAQHDVSGYWTNESTCPFDMPIGRDNFKRINAHIDGSTGTNHNDDAIGTLER